MKEMNYFLERLVFFGWGLGRSFESCDLILAALFLCIAFFLDALSASEIAFMIRSLLLPFLAFLMAISRPTKIDLLTIVFLAEPLKALLAVLVTGMAIV